MGPYLRYMPKGFLNEQNKIQLVIPGVTTYQRHRDSGLTLENHVYDASDIDLDVARNVADALSLTLVIDE